MKCVKFIGPKHKNPVGRAVGRYTEEEAEEMVSSGQWAYTTKETWREYKAKAKERENVLD